MISGFGPIAVRNAKVLVLGTIPGRQSLAMGQYYANPQNAFWFIMERLFQAKAELDYEARTAMVKAAGVAVWDVLFTAERDRSVDAAIVAGSEVANDFSAFFSLHKQIRSVFFNGAKAEALFCRKSVACRCCACLQRALQTPASRKTTNSMRGGPSWTP
jgi:TDG/mug DNA glycosylase family protein